jgi:hypothetical protein
MARKPAAKHEPEKRWKRFVLEGASVAGGVLLALIVDQTAENWREKRRVEDQRVSMNAEIADFAEIFALRMRFTRCVTAKLDAIEAFVQGKGPAAPLQNIGRPLYYFSGRGAWNGDNSDQVARYLGADKFKRYSELYQGMEQYTDLSAEEQVSWVPLLALEGDSDALTPDRRARLREAIAQARNEQLVLEATAGTMLEQARTLGVNPNGGLRSIKLEEKPICKTLSTAGAAPAG